MMADASVAVRTGSVPDQAGGSTVGDAMADLLNKGRQAPPLAIQQTAQAAAPGYMVLPSNIALTIVSPTAHGSTTVPQSQMPARVSAPAGTIIAVHPSPHATQNTATLSSSTLQLSSNPSQPMLQAGTVPGAWATVNTTPTATSPLAQQWLLLTANGGNQTSGGGSTCTTATIPDPIANSNNTVPLQQPGSATAQYTFSSSGGPEATLVPVGAPQVVMHTAPSSSPMYTVVPAGMQSQGPIQVWTCPSPGVLANSLQLIANTAPVPGAEQMTSPLSQVTTSDVDMSVAHHRSDPGSVNQAQFGKPPPPPRLSHTTTMEVLQSSAGALPPTLQLQTMPRHTDHSCWTTESVGPLNLRYPNANGTLPPLPLHAALSAPPPSSQTDQEWAEAAAAYQLQPRFSTVAMNPNAALQMQPQTGSNPMDWTQQQQPPLGQQNKANELPQMPLGGTVTSVAELLGNLTSGRPTGGGSSRPGPRNELSSRGASELGAGLLPPGTLTLEDLRKQSDAGTNNIDLSGYYSNSNAMNIEDINNGDDEGEDDNDRGTAAMNRATKRSRKAARQTALTITYEQLSALFHVPIHEAAARLGVGLTLLKRVCRSHGIKRWPFRQVQSLETLIVHVETQVSTEQNKSNELQKKGYASGPKVSRTEGCLEQLRARQEALTRGESPMVLLDTERKLAQRFAKIRHLRRKIYTQTGGGSSTENEMQGNHTSGAGMTGSDDLDDMPEHMQEQMQFDATRVSSAGTGAQSQQQDVQPGVPTAPNPLQSVTDSQTAQLLLQIQQQSQQLQQMQVQMQAQQAATQQVQQTVLQAISNAGGLPGLQLAAALPLSQGLSMGLQVLPAQNGLGGLVQTPEAALQAMQQLQMQPGAQLQLLPQQGLPSAAHLIAPQTAQEQALQLALQSLQQLSGQGAALGFPNLLAPQLPLPAALPSAALPPPPDGDGKPRQDGERQELMLPAPTNIAAAALQFANQPKADTMQAAQPTSQLEAPHQPMEVGPVHMDTGDVPAILKVAALAAEESAALEKAASPLAVLPNHTDANQQQLVAGASLQQQPAGLPTVSQQVTQAPETAYADVSDANMLAELARQAQEVEAQAQMSAAPPDSHDTPKDVIKEEQPPPPPPPPPEAAAAAVPTVDVPQPVQASAAVVE